MRELASRASAHVESFKSDRTNWKRSPQYKPKHRKR